MRCTEPHPEDPERICQEPSYEQHANHNDGRRLPDSSWANDAFVSPVPRKPPSKRRTRNRLGEFLGQRGQEAAVSAAEGWSDRALGAIRTLAAGREEFTSDDVVERVGLPNESETNANNALGGVFGSASRQGIIVKVERREPSRRAESHGRDVQVWVGA